MPPDQPISVERTPNPDAAQLAAWQALWRLLLTPRPQPDGQEQRPAE